MAAPSEPRDPGTPAASLDKSRCWSPRFNEKTVPPNRSLRRARDTFDENGARLCSASGKCISAITGRDLMERID